MGPNIGIVPSSTSGASTLELYIIGWTKSSTILSVELIDKLKGNGSNSFIKIEYFSCDLSKAILIAYYHYQNLK